MCATQNGPAQHRNVAWEGRGGLGTLRPAKSRGKCACEHAAPPKLVLIWVGNRSLTASNGLGGDEVTSGVDTRHSGSGPGHEAPRSRQIRPVFGSRAGQEGGNQGSM